MRDNKMIESVNDLYLAQEVDKLARRVRKIERRHRLESMTSVAGVGFSLYYIYRFLTTPTK